MATTTIYLGEGDREPVLDAVIKDAAGSAIDLTGATVQFRYWLKGDADADATVVTCSLTDAANGSVRASWGASDTTTPGLYEGFFRVTFSSGKTMAAPNKAYIELRIRDDR